MQGSGPVLTTIREQLEQATAAKKCWPCGCFQNTVQMLEKSMVFSKELAPLLAKAHQAFVPQRYDCLGCILCWPAEAMNAATVIDPTVAEADRCPTEEPERRQGWPPLPGSYTVLRYHASVAVCTLTDDNLAATVAREAAPEVAVVGTLQTENLGIERLILNVIANPHIRFLIVCGADSRQSIGHLPGQSLAALARSGLGDHSRIIGARGKRPILRNITREAVEHFCRTVEVIDLVSNGRVSAILNAVQDCAARNLSPAEAFITERGVRPLAGYLPERMVLDPAGYFVIYVDQRRQLLALEHYRNDGVLDTVIEGSTAAELYTPAIEKELVSRLDHAAYLGRELARAEQALLSGEAYAQDAAPERLAQSFDETQSCGFSSSCEENRR
jgi:tetrahydromethanopterin S-methyltransferase subunit A